MKKYFLVFALLFVVGAAFSQPGKKTTTGQKPPSQSEMDKMMEDAMKGMSPEEKAEMKKMMGGVMSEMKATPATFAAPFTDNKKLVPAKDLKRIKSIPTKPFTDADVIANSALLYSKLMAKIPATQKAIVNKVVAAAKTGTELMSGSVTCMLQGHNMAAMALAMKAVQADSKNVNLQNNLAAILSQSGYPEKAVPYLKKLTKDLPDNSTVLHNLGYAWLSLGEVDTANRYFAFAAARNPHNPETKLCRGVIDELKGDPKKASDNYVEAFEEAPNPFTENMAKNVNAQDRLEKIDFDKLKKRIVIHEYFKKDWIKIPVLSDNVSGFENDRRIQNGYGKMFEELKANIELMIEASNAEVEALADKGLVEFQSTMAKEMMKGMNMMSMPAVYVQKILAAYNAKWMMDYAKEHQALKDLISKKRAETSKTGKNDKCPDFDRKNNEFMKYANHRIREFHTQKIEEFRVWLNAFCTWSWYIVGNPKNVILTNCIAWTGAFVNLLEAAVSEQYCEAKSCVTQNGDGVMAVTTPIVPNFSCPAVVSIPIGLDELRISSESINFNDNSWNISQAPGTIPHNTTIGIGVGKSHVAEPGKFGTPYTKTGDGSFSATGMGGTSGEMDELAPLDPSLLNGNKNSIVNDVRAMARAKMARKILKDMMSVKCPGELPKKNPRKTKFNEGRGKQEKDEFVVGLGELEWWNEEMQAWETAKGQFRKEDGFIFGLGELEMWNEDKMAWENSKGEFRYEAPLKLGVGELEVWMEEDQAWVNAKGDHRFKSGLIVGLGELELLDVETSGPQVTITNGLELIGIAQDFIKGLFE